MENELVIFNKYAIIERCIKRINSVYEYQELDLEILKNILDEHLEDLINFGQQILKLERNG